MNGPVLVKWLTCERQRMWNCWQEIRRWWWWWNRGRWRRLEEQVDVGDRQLVEVEVVVVKDSEVVGVPEG